MIRGTTGLREAYRDDQVARSYIDERFRQPLGALLHRRQVDVVRGAIETHRPHRVLEIAPGPARVTSGLDAVLVGRSVTLVDASAQMLAEARLRLRRSGQGSYGFVQADAFNLPFAEPFDLVYSFRLIRHFEFADRARLYAQIARLVRPGGWLIFDAVNEVVSAPVRAAAPPGEYAHYDALLRPDAIRDELRTAGFDSISLHGVQHRYPLLAQLQILVAPRSQAVARGAMEIVDRLGGGEPLEWVVTCRRG